MNNKINIIIAAPGKGVGKGGVVRQMQYLKSQGDINDDEISFHWLCTHSNNKLWPIFFIATITNLLWLILTKNINFIHLNIASKGSFYRKFILFIISSLFGVKSISHLHGGAFKEFYDNGSSIRKKCIKQLFTKSDNILVLGKIWAEFAESIGVNSKKIHILPNAVPTPENPSKGGGENIHIIFAGQLLPRKGVGELIEALAELKHLKWRATFAGSGELDKYKAKSHASGLSDRINFTGWLDDSELNELYHESDILVLPSYVENQPLCILEAMAHGLAVIATNVGTVNETIKKDTGIVIELSQIVPSLRSSISMLIEDPDLLNKHKKTARLQHIEDYTLSAYYSNYKSIIIYSQ